MKKHFNFEVKTPCSENFDQFTPTENGGYCNSCSKEVIDFTQMKSEDIHLYFQKGNNQKTCGKFGKDQLRQLNTSNNSERRLSLAIGFGIACLALFSFSPSQAQTKTTSNTKTSAVVADGILVKGNVSEGKSPIPGVNILLQGTTIGTETDFNGNFVFPKKLNKGDVLLFSYIGYKSQKVVITENSSAVNVGLKLDMELDTIFIMGDVATKRVYKSRN